VIEQRVVPIEAIGHTAHVVQANVNALCGLFRLYVATGSQPEEATLSAVSGLAECQQAGGRAAVTACLALVRSRLTSGHFAPDRVASWLTELATETDGW
jgi:hypothetical protein